MSQFFLSPPIVLFILVLLGIALSYVSGSLAPVGKDSDRKGESYACGQRNVVHSVSPDYGQFYPFAFFFTIMHVLVLVVATAPTGALVLPLLYVGVGVLSLLIIFRR